MRTGRTIRLVLLIVGVFVAQLAAAVVNVATSTGASWPGAFDDVRRHRFRWAAILTAASWAWDASILRGANLPDDVGLNVPVPRFDESSIEARRQFVASFRSSARELAAWLLLVRDHLRDLDDVYADVAGGLTESASRVPRIARYHSPHLAAIDEVRAALPAWREHTARSAELIEEYLTNFVGLSTVLRVKHPQAGGSGLPA